MTSLLIAYITWHVRIVPALATAAESYLDTDCTVDIVHNDTYGTNDEISMF